MKRIAVAAVAALLAVSSLAAAEAPAKADDDTLYALGIAMSEGIQAFHLSEAELAVVVRGLTDGVLGKEPKVDVAAYQAQIREFAADRAKVTAKEERAKGKDFLEKAAAKEGVRKTGTGLLLEAIAEGTGKSPTSNSRVTVQYTGTLIDGTVFDSSLSRGTPATFSLSSVIPCWTEGLQFMKEGGKARLYCPADLAYGERGSPPKIPPGATIVFEVELLQVLD